MEKPTWLDKAKIKISLDAREILARGEHPLERVLHESALLNPGEIYEIITPFPPVPMIQKLSDAGFESFSEQDDAGLYHTYFANLSGS
jgi:uncharacterized protein (DUF2249 family)